MWASGGRRRAPDLSWERRDGVGAVDLSRASVGGAYCCDGVGCRPRMEDLGLGGFAFFIFFTAFSIPTHANFSVCVCFSVRL